MRSAFLLLTVALAWPSLAGAQDYVVVGPTFVARGVPLAAPPNPAIPSYGTPRVTSDGTYLPAYDYYAAPYPLPARIYNGYGDDGFAFHGRPYGHAWTPWSWEALGRTPASGRVQVYRVLGP